MALNWYLKKEYFDTVDDIEQVLIHYACTPLGGTPDWTQAESRALPAGELLRTGVGEVAKYGPPAPAVPQEVHPRLRKKVLRLPNEVFDPALGAWTGDYQLHYVYEVIRNGDRSFSPIFVDEIRTREVVMVDPVGVTGGACVNWSVYDWDAPQFSPTEEPGFVERYGEDHPLRQHKFYGTEDREAFAVAKKALVDRLPLPRRFRTRISAPVGATVRVRLHTGNWGLPEDQRWEDYWLDESFVMEAGLEPLVLTPLGTQVAAEPLSVVTPDLLVGNPYAELLTGEPTEEPVAAEPFPAKTVTVSPAQVVREVEAVMSGPTRELVATG